MEVLRSQAITQTIVSEIAYVTESVGEVCEIVCGIIGVCGCSVRCRSVLDDLRKIGICIGEIIFNIPVGVDRRRSPT
jgi:hypothetical protein